MDIGEDTGSMPEESYVCHEKRPKYELAENAKKRLVREITSAVTNAVVRVFNDKGNYLFRSACGTNGTKFSVSSRPVSKSVREQALREALERIMADADKLIEPPKNRPAEPSSYQERARSLLR